MALKVVSKCFSFSSIDYIVLSHGLTYQSSSSSGKWCTVRQNGTVSTYGCAFRYVKQPITRTITKSKGGKHALNGFISAVMKNRSVANGSLHFKVVDSDNNLLEYVPCKAVMSKSKAKNNPYKVTY